MPRPASTRPDWDQPTLFEPVPPNVRTTDPDTSHEAAGMNPAGRHTDRARALEWHRFFPNGLTDYELADLMGRQQNSAGKRRGELVALGYIRDSGQRRPTPSGATAVVWQVTR